MTHEAMMVGLRVKLLDPAEPGSETTEATTNETQQKDSENSQVVTTTKSLKWWMLGWWFLEILPLIGWQTHKGHGPPQYSLWVLRCLITAADLSPHLMLGGPIVAKGV